MRAPRIAILLTLAMGLAQAAVAAPEAPLRLPSFEGLASNASRSVNVTLDSNLLGIAADFLDPGNPQDQVARELISGLKAIYVRSYQFDGHFTYPSAEVDSLRKQLATGGWQAVVRVRGRKDEANVDVYLSVEHGKANGLAIIASAPREFTIVNIVGSIDLQKLHRLQGKFGIPNLPLDSAPGP